MIVTDRQEELGLWISKKIGVGYIKDKAVYIGWVINNVIKCVVSYESYAKRSIVAGIAAENTRIPIEFIRYAFYYPFEQLKVNKIITIIQENNQKSLKIIKHMGFEEECRITDACESGDLIIATVTRNRCKYI